MTTAKESGNWLENPLGTPTIDDLRRALDIRISPNTEIKMEEKWKDLYNNVNQLLDKGKKLYLPDVTMYFAHLKNKQRNATFMLRHTGGIKKPNPIHIWTTYQIGDTPLILSPISVFPDRKISSTCQLLFGDTFIEDPEEVRQLNKAFSAYLEGAITQHQWTDTAAFISRRPDFVLTAINDFMDAEPDIELTQRYIAQLESPR